MSYTTCNVFQKTKFPYYELQLFSNESIDRKFEMLDIMHRYDVLRSIDLDDLRNKENLKEKLDELFRYIKSKEPKVQEVKPVIPKAGKKLANTLRILDNLSIKDVREMEKRLKSKIPKFNSTTAINGNKQSTIQDNNNTHEVIEKEDKIINSYESMEEKITKIVLYNALVQNGTISKCNKINNISKANENNYSKTDNNYQNKNKLVSSKKQKIISLLHDNNSILEKENKIHTIENIGSNCNSNILIPYIEYNKFSSNNVLNTIASKKPSNTNINVNGYYNSNKTYNDHVKHSGGVYSVFNKKYFNNKNRQNNNDELNAVKEVSSFINNDKNSNYTINTNINDINDTNNNKAFFSPMSVKNSFKSKLSKNMKNNDDGETNHYLTTKMTTNNNINTENNGNFFFTEANIKNNANNINDKNDKNKLVLKSIKTNSNYTAGRKTSNLEDNKSLLLNNISLKSNKNAMSNNHLTEFNSNLTKNNNIKTTNIDRLSHINSNMYNNNEYDRELITDYTNYNENSQNTSNNASKIIRKKLTNFNIPDKPKLDSYKSNLINFESSLLKSNSIENNENYESKNKTLASFKLKNYNKKLIKSQLTNKTLKTIKTTRTNKSSKTKKTHLTNNTTISLTNQYSTLDIKTINDKIKLEALNKEYEMKKNVDDEAIHNTWLNVNSFTRPHILRVQKFSDKNISMRNKAFSIDKKFDHVKSKYRKLMNEKYFKTKNVNMRNLASSPMIDEIIKMEIKFNDIDTPFTRNYTDFLLFDIEKSVFGNLNDIN